MNGMIKMWRENNDNNWVVDISEGLITSFSFPGRLESIGPSFNVMSGWGKGKGAVEETDGGVRTI